MFAVDAATVADGAVAVAVAVAADVDVDADVDADVADAATAALALDKGNEDDVVALDCFNSIDGSNPYRSTFDCAMACRRARTWIRNLLWRLAFDSVI